MSEGESVKVAVRVRPFNQREKDAKSKLVISMSGSQTVITNPKSNEEKKFNFDYSYWSHDGFKTDSNGYFSPESSKYADQKKVYDDLGAGVLKNAWEGYNASLFAYGQTGSGKSYSVVGYGSNKGIVPIVSEEIFKKTDSMKSSGKIVEVTFSMLEIYSEVVRDLLVTTGDRKKGLEIRQDPNNGFYAQGLRKQLVASYADISRLTDEGTANRTIAATNMNATSSRAHTIVTISLVQKYKNEAGKEMAKSSVINLVDLAGSERADQTGATGDRLKEGAAINLSLTSLGNVISALADQSSGKNVKVPYRDSVLTKLLMNALGGNSKTIMIAAISPADINYDESLSTLRYADRAKQIKTKAIINEDPTEKLIKNLQEENARLKKLLETGGKVDPSLINGSGGSNANHESDEALKKQLEENDKAMKAMKQTYEEKLAEAAKTQGGSERAALLQKAKTNPHLTNINMDPSLSGSIKLILEGEGVKKIGVAGKSDIPLSGLGILDPHGAITKKGNKITIEKYNNARLLLNGKPLDTIAELNHLDRLVFGASQYYTFIDPSKSTPKDNIYTFEMAQDEIANSNGMISKDDKKNMTQDEIQCQGELIDLIPLIEEANMISIALDKKVKFSPLAVAAAARGDYDGKVKAFVSVKNFANGLEWIWEKNKFMDRKHDMTELYLDFKDDGTINNDKFKNNYDPFFESPDTPTQVGTAFIVSKPISYLMPAKTQSKIIDLRSKDAGLLNIEIIPCNAQGQALTEKESALIKDPQKDLVNKNMSFLFKISNISNLNSLYEDIFCELRMFDDPTVYKTDVIKGTNTGDFKFTRQFTYLVTPKLLDAIMNKCFFVKVFGEQKHPNPSQINNKLTTKEFFEKDKQNTQNNANNSVNNNANTNPSKTVSDQETQKLKDDLRASLEKQKKYELKITNMDKLISASNNQPVHPQIIKDMMNASTDQEANKILAEFPKRNAALIGVNQTQSRPQSGRRTEKESSTCTLL